MEKGPSYENIIGGTVKQKNILQEKHDEESMRSGEELFGESLLEPELIEKTAITMAIEYANSIATKYGATNLADPDRVFLLQPGGTSFFHQRLFGTSSSAPAAYYSAQRAIIADREKSKALLAMKVAHESFHAAGYRSYEIMKSGFLLRTLSTLMGQVDSKEYRKGIEMEGREKEANYFSIAHEAIVSKLSRQFFDEVISKHPAYAEDATRTKAIKQWIIDNVPQAEIFEDALILPDSEALYKKIIESNASVSEKTHYIRHYLTTEMEEGRFLTSERREERKRFDKVIDKIIKDSAGKISDKDELFDDFAKAHFSGNYLPLARKVENALGKGSFRKIGLELGEIHSEPLKKWFAENSWEKPPYLYHGTLGDEIDEFEPRSAPERPDEEPAVYASPDVEIATQSIANKYVSNGGILNGRKFVCIPMSREEFIKLDKGGVIYTLPSDSFTVNYGKGISGGKEWVSKTPVKPVAHRRIPSFLQKMHEQKTEVYFIEPELVPIITKAQNNPERLEAVLAKLKDHR